MIYNCLFCQSEIHIGEFSGNYSCLKCPLNITYYWNALRQQMLDYYFSINYKGVNYNWYFRLQGWEDSSWRNYQSALTTYRSNKEVIGFATKPEITPDNIMEKLSLYLTFS